MRSPLYLRWSRAYRDALRHRREGDHARAEGDLLEAVHVAERMRPQDDRLGCSLYALARLRQLHGDVGSAGRLYQRALAAEISALGPGHPFTASVARAYAAMLGQPEPERSPGRLAGADRARPGQTAPTAWRHRPDQGPTMSCQRRPTASVR